MGPLTGRRPFLVAALSGRALAAAARRSGHAVAVLDLFGDLDTRALAAAVATVDGDPEHGFDADALLETAARLVPAGRGLEAGLVYGAGFEMRPELLAALSAGRRLLGNSPEALARVKDPAAFFGLLDRLGLPHPEISLTPPADRTGWLRKRIGGSGGGHVRPCRVREPSGEGLYFQRRVEGRPLSVLFLADGRGAVRLLGFSEQWASPGGTARPYRYGGAAGPVRPGARLARDMTAAVGSLARELGLVGLNSLDALVDGGGYSILEVNPRPGATLDVLDDQAEDPKAGLFGLHVAACEGRLPAGQPTWVAAVAAEVVYADRRNLIVPPGISWPDWTADRPAAGMRIDRGGPICTVLARARTPGAARAKAAVRRGAVLSALGAAHPAFERWRRQHGT